MAEITTSEDLQSLDMSIIASSPANQIFQSDKLLNIIMLHLHMQDLFRMHQVNVKCKTLIETSAYLSGALFLMPNTSTERDKSTTKKDNSITKNDKSSVSKPQPPSNFNDAATKKSKPTIKTIMFVRNYMILKRKFKICTKGTRMMVFKSNDSNGSCMVDVAYELPRKYRRAGYLKSYNYKQEVEVQKRLHRGSWRRMLVCRPSTRMYIQFWVGMDSQMQQRHEAVLEVGQNSVGDIASSLLEHLMEAGWR